MTEPARSSKAVVSPVAKHVLSPRRRLPWLAVLCGAAAALLAGCRPFDHHHAPGSFPVVPSPLEPPREKVMVSHPVYRIEPPDLLSIEVEKLVPRPPYRFETYDLLRIEITFAGDPFPAVSDYFLVEPEGTLNLGAAYGVLRVAGLTADEARQAITQHLRQTNVEPSVLVQLYRAAGTQQINGVYLVGPDGTINLRQYGAVHVAGKTLVDARLAIEKQLSQFFDMPAVSVDMQGYNSKVYYIITEGANLGDNVVRMPITGNETVLDAIAQIGGLSQLSSKTIWVARPAPPNFGCEQILPVEWEAIAKGGVTATNYQILPGDRIFIAEDQLVATNNLLSKLISPLERLFGVTGLGTSTVRNTQTLGRSYNRTRNQ
jgi:polysaccharide export outer membrane protein